MDSRSSGLSSLADSLAQIYYISDDLIILHVDLSGFLEGLVKRWLQEAGVPDTVVVLASHALVGSLLDLGVDAAAGCLLDRRSEASFRFCGYQGVVPLPEPILLHDLLELIFHALHVGVVVPRPKVALVIFDDVKIAVGGVLARHDLDLLLGLETLSATIEGDQVLFLSYRVLQIALLPGHILVEQLTLVVVDVPQFGLHLLVFRGLDGEVLLGLTAHLVVLLRDEGDALHFLLFFAVHLLLHLGHGAGVQFWLALLATRLLLVCHLELSLDVPSINLGTLKHLQVVDWDVGLRLCVESGLAAVLDDASYSVTTDIATIHTLATETSGSVPHLKRIDWLFSGETGTARRKSSFR